MRLKGLGRVLSLITCATLLSCGGDSDSGYAPVSTPITPIAPVTTPPATSVIACDDSLKVVFKPDENTEVVGITQFHKGDDFPNRTLEQQVLPSVPARFDADLCLVTLRVGPAIEGPMDAPSTSRGIGIEIWLPAKEVWTGRAVSLGGTGWVGGEELDLTKISTNSASGDVGPRSAPHFAAIEAAVTSTTDAGNRVGIGGAFGLKPDGTINTQGWETWSVRALREQASKTRALATLYYGTAPKYMYFSGQSGGGRQAMKAAQELYDLYDGILAGVPAVNWFPLLMGVGYPQVVTNNDLNGAALSNGQQILLGNTATAACDLVGGQHLGFILDIKNCRYDPTKDSSVLCLASGGANASSDCVSTEQAYAMNKIWYGATVDGSAPDPALDNGWDSTLGTSRKWFGLSRGLATSLITKTPMQLPGDAIANALLDPNLAPTSFSNASGNGQGKYVSMSYAGFANAFHAAEKLQPQFSYANSNSPDLSSFKKKGGKLISYSATNDTLVPPQGLMYYYDRVSTAIGGIAEAQSFFRIYLLPGVGHLTYMSSSTNPAANPPIAGQTLFWNQLTDWVEKGISPSNPTISTPSGTLPTKSLLLCAYPASQRYAGGDPFQSSSYMCK